MTNDPTVTASRRKTGLIVAVIAGALVVGGGIGFAIKATSAPTCPEGSSSMVYPDCGKASDDALYNYGFTKGYLQQLQSQQQNPQDVYDRLNDRIAQANKHTKDSTYGH